MWLQIKKLKISPVVLAAILVGGGLILVIVISLCTYLCCCRKDGKGKRAPQENTLENPPEAKGKDHGRPARQSEQQNNSPRIARPSVASALPPPTAGTSASSLQKPPIRSPKHLPVGSSMSSSITGSSLEVHVSKQSLTPQWAPPSSIGSEKSNLSGHESLMPPPSPVPSFGSSQTMFSYRDLAMATNNFSEANQLGQGGFGFVHKGVLPNGKAIAVKSLKANSKQGEREFQAEIETISRVHHRHLVSLVGYCITGSRRLLVYEYVPNNTLVFHLHGKGKPTMNWSIRMKVAVGVAKGLAYLHEDCDPKIIHRDIKAANILLDNNFLAKVADFGLAKFSSKEVTHVSTRVMGTLGYLAPEYASTGKLTEKSDVYSFGVLLLELVTGRRPVDKTKEVQNLVQWARPLLTRAIDIESFDYLVDPRLQNNYDHNEMLRIVACAATCVRTSARRRPLMSQVVRALEGNIELSDITEGITPGYSSAHDYGTGSEYSSSSQYTDWRDFDSTGVTVSTVEYISSEHDVISSEYGLNPSDSSSQSQPQTTQELDTEEINKVRRRLQIS